MIVSFKDLFCIPRICFYGIINDKTYYHHEHTYCYLGRYKNKVFEQKIMGNITKVKILLINNCDFIEKDILRT